MPPKRTTRSQSKAEEKKKAKKDEEESEEEEEEEDTKKGKKGSKTNAKAAQKGAAKKKANAKDADDEEDEESEEDTKKAKGAKGKKGAQTKAKTTKKQPAKKKGKGKDEDDEEEEEESEEETKTSKKTQDKKDTKTKDDKKSNAKKDDKMDDEDEPKTRRSTRGATKKTDKDKDEDGDDETDKKDSNGKRKADKSPDDTKDQKKEPAKKTKADKDDDKAPAEEKLVKVIARGGVAVDEHFPDKDCVVLVHNNKAYAKTLNQSNLNHNNNKFYIIQILENPKQKGVYSVYNRWGRVGVKGQDATKKFSDVNAAIRAFEDKLYDKTVKGDYREIEINYGDDEEEQNDNEESKDEDNNYKSKLPTSTKDLIKLIFDLKMMNEQMKEIGYDPKKMPLGKLAKSSIEKGYAALKAISEAINKNASTAALNNLSSDFYSYIPHDFGFQQMSSFVIKTDKQVKEKLEMLASLEDIQVATKLLSQGGNKGEESLYDSNYSKLKCELDPVEKGSDEFKMIQEYVKNTHASTHSSYSLEVAEVWRTNKEGEDERYKKDLHNKMLLWHGSRLTNYVGILSQGLRIAPPEAPVTGYMFGKGVYFADMVSKSANYCFTNPTNNTGLMLLCEVALGNCNEKLQADYYAANLPNDKHSTKGVGKNAPPVSSYKKIDGDVAVPIGKGENSGVQGSSLLYNEYIVYDLAQIKLKYLLRMKFNYRSNY